MRRFTAMAALIAVFVGLSYAAWAQETAPEQQRISLDLRDAEIRSALDMLFKSKPGSSYVLDQGVTGAVNMKLDEVTWVNALRSMLTAAKLDYRVEDNIYHIFPKSTATTTTSYGGGANTGGTGTSTYGGGRTSVSPGATTPGVGATTVGRTGTKNKFQLVTVKYSDPAEMAALFGGTAVGFSYGGASMGGMSGLGGMSGYGGIGGGYGGIGGGGYGGIGGGGYGGIGGGGYGGMSGGYGGIGGGGYGGIGGGGYGGIGGGGYGGYGGMSGGYGGIGGGLGGRRY